MAFQSHMPHTSRHFAQLLRECVPILIVSEARIKCVGKTLETAAEPYRTFFQPAPLRFASNSEVVHRASPVASDVLSFRSFAYVCSRPIKLVQRSSS